MDKKQKRNPFQRFKSHSYSEGVYHGKDYERSPHKGGGIIMIVKVATVHEIPYDTIYIPGIKTGSKIVIIKEPTCSLINMKEMTISPAIRTPIKPGFAAVSSLTAASIGIDFNDDTLIVIPIERSKKHYAFVYKDKHKRKFVCINVAIPKTVSYFPIIWDNKNIPNGPTHIISEMKRNEIKCIK